MKLLLVSALASTSLFIGSLSADPYTVIRTITHSENALWNTAGGDLKPIVALDPDYFVIATKGRRLTGGAAYVFDASDGAFLRRLTASDAGEGMEFGAALAVDGGFALVGAPNKFISASNRGKAYLYNLATDPYEQNNLAAEHPELVSGMKDRLNALGRDAAKPLALIYITSVGLAHGKPLIADEGAEPPVAVDPNGHSIIEEDVGELTDL